MHGALLLALCGAAPHPVWELVSDGGPSPRYLHAMAYEPDLQATLLFGGELVDGDGGQDTWLWDGGSWASVTVPGPPPRRGTALVFDSSDRDVLLFGGENGGAAFADTWVFKGSAWIQLMGAAIPPGRHRAGFAYDTVNATAVLFGGLDQAVYLGDQWSFASGTDNWGGGASCPDSGIAFPSIRASASMVETAPSQLLMYGGYTYYDCAGPIAATALDDAWAWSGAAQTWTQVCSGCLPGPRARFGMAYDAARNRTVLFGGRVTDNLAAPLGDTWELDGTSWQPMSPPVSPLARHSTAMVYDSARHRVVLFGGNAACAGTGTVCPGVAPCNCQLLDDTWEYHVRGGPCDAGCDDFCSEGVCCDVAACPLGSSCAVPGQEGACVAVSLPDSGLPDAGGADVGGVDAGFSDAGVASPDGGPVASHDAGGGVDGGSPGTLAVACGCAGADGRLCLALILFFTWLVRRGSGRA